MGEFLSSGSGIFEGGLLAGKYRLGPRLGTGGMGVVFAAHHIALDEKVAIKFLLPEALGNAEAKARFARARAAAKIKSEHVARVIDVDALPDGMPYIVMEYLEGEDLGAWIEKRGPLAIGRAVEFVLQGCIGLADAHALGIVHRDLKPANLFCVRRSDGQLLIKVLDFGISKMASAPALQPPSITRTSALMGSPQYMSPEQMRGARDIDAQTDIWALGVILFELLAGRPAFTAETITELAIKVANDRAPAIRFFRPDVPFGLETIIFKCLEKSRLERYINVAELARALLPYAPAGAQALVDRTSGIIRAAGLAADAPRTASISPLRIWLATRSGRRIGGAALGFLVTLVALGLGALVVVEFGPETRTKVSPPAEPPVTVSSLPVASSPAVAPSAVVAPAAIASASSGLVDGSAIRVPAPWLPEARPASSFPPATLSASPQAGAPSGGLSPGSPSGSPPAAAPTSASLAASSPAGGALPPPPARVKSNCNPPYVIDSEGYRQYKPECL